MYRLNKAQALGGERILYTIKKRKQHKLQVHNQYVNISQQYFSQTGAGTLASVLEKQAKRTTALRSKWLT